MKTITRFILALVLGVSLFGCSSPATSAPPSRRAELLAGQGLSPLLAEGKPVDWWFVFKFNDKIFPGDMTKEPSQGIFGGTPAKYKQGFSLSYACASSAHPALEMGAGSIGTSKDDPLGATFSQIYFGNYNYVLWNDQFYGDPIPSANSPWGHSKGALAWDENGQGFVLQVSTPSWPASGNVESPRKTDGNTLGCIKDDDVLVSQHFFALKLTPDDVSAVLEGLANASVVTKPDTRQIFNAGGPANLKELAAKLGTRSKSDTVYKKKLSSGVTFISKPSQLAVPPWQMVSAELGGVGLRVATWWEKPYIYSTSATTAVTCWDPSLGKPGPVEIAISGEWQAKPIGLKGGANAQGNHAKVGVSKAEDQPYSIFGDLNQQGTLDASGNVKPSSAQNGRGGTFYVLDNPDLWKSLRDLLRGDSAPLAP